LDFERLLKRREVVRFAAGEPRNSVELSPENEWACGLDRE
jgi:hypothetical protein